MSSFTDTNYAKEPPCLTRQSTWFSEHRDLQATAMSVDWSGQYILLAGRRHLALQSLDQFDDEDSLRKFYRNSKHEVSAAEWAICPESQEYCAIATSQLIEVVTWRSGDPTQIHSLRAHTRVITDIDWHSKQPHLLASCSIDTFTHLWDLRDPRKPMLSLSAVCMSGATQVGFNRVSGNLLATAHDGDLRIWDQRMGSCPIQYITAHLARIHGINWSHQHETSLTTSSQDGTVKYFDINNPRRAERIITNSSPVWRARYTPFADGLVTVIVPHLGRGENSVLLWNNSTQQTPICSFVGHTDVVLDFAWRPNRRTESPDMELITWSRDQTVRVWNVDEALQKLCEPPQPVDSDPYFDDSPIEALHVIPGATSIPASSNASAAPPTASEPTTTTTSASTIRPHRPVSAQPSCSLQHEFSLLNTNIPHVDIEVLDPIKRNATVRISVNGHIIMLQVLFPPEYPAADRLPEFTYCQGTTLTAPDLCDSLMKVLRSCAVQRARKGRTCLEQCLRALVTALKKATSSGDKAFRLQSPRLEGALSGALHDACVPFPRTSGARFSQVGQLVVFAQPPMHGKPLPLGQLGKAAGYGGGGGHQPPQQQQQQQPQQPQQTPRALSALSGGYLGNVMGTQPVLYTHSREAGGAAATASAALYLHERVRKSSRRGAAPRVLSSPRVLVYDLRALEPVSRELAELYVLDSRNAAEMCRHNARVAAELGYAEVAQGWSLAELLAASNSELEADDDVFFNQIPFPKNCLEKMILHFAENHDIQTAAMLCCAFGRQCPPYELSRRSSLSIKSTSHSQLLSGQRISKPSGSPYHTILPVDTKNQQWTLASQLKQFRSNSWSDSLDECRVAGFDFNRTILGDSQRQLYDNFKRSYAELLYRWGLLCNRAKVLKYLSCASDQPRGVEFVTECVRCTRVTPAATCRDCRTALLHCSVCRLPVRGAANACLQCGHGGHTEHLWRWFAFNSLCASGCGCQCLAASAQIVEI